MVTKGESGETCSFNGRGRTWCPSLGSYCGADYTEFKVARRSRSNRPEYDDGPAGHCSERHSALEHDERIATGRAGRHKLGFRGGARQIAGDRASARQSDHRPSSLQRKGRPHAAQGHTGQCLRSDQGQDHRKAEVVRSCRDEFLAPSLTKAFPIKGRAWLCRLSLLRRPLRHSHAASWKMMPSV
jgi:hypothetical protein